MWSAVSHSPTPVPIESVLSQSPHWGITANVGSNSGLVKLAITRWETPPVAWLLAVMYCGNQARARACARACVPPPTQPPTLPSAPRSSLTHSLATFSTYTIGTTLSGSDVTTRVSWCGDLAGLTHIYYSATGTRKRRGTSPDLFMPNYLIKPTSRL